MTNLPACLVRFLIFVMVIFTACTKIICGSVKSDIPTELWSSCGEKMCNHFIEYCYPGGSCSPCNKAECDNGNPKCVLACVLLPKLTKTEQQLAEQEMELNNTKLIVKEREQTILNKKNQLANKDKEFKDVTSKWKTCRVLAYIFGSITICLVVIVIVLIIYKRCKCALIGTKASDKDCEQQLKPLIPTAPHVSKLKKDKFEVATESHTKNGETKGTATKDDSGVSSSSMSSLATDDSQAAILQTSPKENKDPSLQILSKDFVGSSESHVQMFSAVSPSNENKHAVCSNHVVCPSGTTPQGRTEKEKLDEEETDTKMTEIE